MAHEPMFWILAVGLMLAVVLLVGGGSRLLGFGPNREGARGWEPKGKS